MPLTSRELLRGAMQRRPVGRIPTMPQICHDTPARLYAAADGQDWIDAMACCIRRPAAIYEYVIRLVEDVNCDGLRLFIKPEPMNVIRRGDDLFVTDPRSGEAVGQVDTHGGGGILRDRPDPPVTTLDEARRRLREIAGPLTDAQLSALTDARQRVKDRFVASAPGGITMDGYAILRGREQAMFDLYERPEMVTAVMDMQAEAAAQRADQLLQTGIDALYIGDPSASASLISPQHFERFCLPAYSAFCRHFAGRDILIYMHVCGNSNPILEMMAESGVHCVEPLDPLGGVSVADAKARIGDRVALMGGVNTLTLARATPDRVHHEAVTKCREGGPDGYILAAGDMVPPATPLANLQALVSVATESSWRV